MHISPGRMPSHASRVSHVVPVVDGQRDCQLQVIVYWSFRTTDWFVGFNRDDWWTDTRTTVRWLQKGNTRVDCVEEGADMVWKCIEVTVWSDGFDWLISEWLTDWLYCSPFTLNWISSTTGCRYGERTNLSNLGNITTLSDRSTVSTAKTEIGKNGYGWNRWKFFIGIVK